jgi:hypothetical protein
MFDKDEDGGKNLMNGDPGEGVKILMVLLVMVKKSYQN